jgi:hypothetical protein
VREGAHTLLQWLGGCERGGEVERGSCVLIVRVWSGLLNGAWAF